MNTYQDSEGEQTCIPCPPGRLTVAPGAEDRDSCIESCGAGHFFDFGSRTCAECALGMYQPESNKTSCITCPAGTNTAQTASKRKEDCDYPCGLGEEMDLSGQCQPCRKGTYKPARNVTACARCPYGLTTPFEGAMFVYQCNIVYCPIGKYKAGNSCEPCPSGTYQDEENQSSCKACPPHTFTIYPGATSIRDCIYGNVDECQLHFAICSPNAQCENTDGGYNCVCNPGYYGNGINCTYKCQNHCQNNGVCYLDSNYQPLCNCSDKYPGPQCEGQPTTPSDRIVSISVGAAAGGVVSIILIISLIVIFKIRIHHFVQCCKRPSLKDISSNQYYRSNTGYSVTETPPQDEMVQTGNAMAVEEDDLKSAIDMMTPADIYSELYAGLQGIQNDRTLSDYLGPIDGTAFDNQAFSRSFDVSASVHKTVTQSTVLGDDDDIGADYFS